MNIRQSWGHLVQLLLSLPGIGVSIYLTAVHYNGAQLVCNNIGLINCERVLNSSYSLVPGTQVPISLPGMAWFVVMAALAVLGLCRDRQLLRQGELLWTALGMLTVFYLLYAEIVRLDAFCVW
ncbi:MAG: vitamin K epoxide reductase family protein, partial [Ktedonobacteraceae bacterium]|nr:vitamin K epoxide reductase family protein [Ktedonobacteraceae bacterium]